MIYLFRSNCWNNLNLLRKINSPEKYQPFPPKNPNLQEKNHTLKIVQTTLKSFNHHEKDPTRSRIKI